MFWQKPKQGEVAWSLQAWSSVSFIPNDGEESSAMRMLR